MGNHDTKGVWLRFDPTDKKIYFKVLSDLQLFRCPAIAPGLNKALNSFTILNSSTDVYRVCTYFLSTSTSFEGVGRFDNPVL